MNPLRSTKLRRLSYLLLAGIGLCLAEASAQQDTKANKGDAAAQGKIEGGIPDSAVKSFNWRSVGPANMSGRITAIAVYEADPTCYWVATASGGLVKTVNNGMTFEHQFENEATVSIGDVCVAPSDKNIVWVGTGEGNPRNSVSYGDGVYKSTDGGKTWKHMGLKETFQIGKILIHPKNPDIVYVGALGRCYGPNKERGVYKTTDGGRTWEQILFKDDKTGVIDMAMHPTDPDTILVAMWERKRDGFDAHLAKEWPAPYDWYDPIVRFGEHAGIYRTTDGGKTFEKMTKGLPPSKIGRIGLDWYRKDPKVVFAIIDCEDIGKGTPPKKIAAKGFAGFVGENSDAGYRVTMILQDGPAAKVDMRVGDIIAAVNDKDVKTQQEYDQKIAEHSAGDKVTLSLKRDNDTQKVELTLAELPQKGFGGKGGGGGGFGGGKGGPKDRPYLVDLGGQNANQQDQQGPDGWKYGGIYRSEDGGASWSRVNSLNDRPMYFSVVRVDPSDEKYVYSLGVSQYRSSNGGKTFTQDAGKGVHADGHAMWIDPKDGRHMLFGCDGGWYVSYDRANTWDHLNNMALGQFYHVAVCNKKPYWIFGGLQDNGSWGLPSVGLKGQGPINEDVISVGGGDGFVCRVDPNDPDLVYSESQGGAMSRRNLRTGEKAAIGPGKGGAGKGKGGGGGGGGGMGGAGYRWNWNTPFILSNFNSKIFYCAGNYVFKSLDRGADLKIISPEITPTKLGSATALSESPVNPDVLWVGTDDGALWVTKNGGKDWTQLSTHVPLRGQRCVATIEASRFKEGRCYVCFDGHRSDDDEPYVFVTEDFGEKWSPIRANLAGFGSTRCLREDIENENLLFCGTEFALFASINRGASWTKINNNLPTVAVHEVAIHPTAGEIAIATHGRSIWIMDVTALRQMKTDVLGKPVHLFKPNTTVRWQNLVSIGGTNRKFVGTNPLPGAAITYNLGEDAKNVTVKVYDVAGELLATPTEGAAGAFGGKAGKGGMGGGGGGGGGKGGKGGMGGGAGGPQLPPNKQGVHVVRWNMMKDVKDGGGGGMGGKGGGGFGGGGFGGAAFNAAPPGVYRVVLNVDGQEYTTTLRIEADPNVPLRPGAPEEEEFAIDPRKIR
jgi:photosystem II stability/assembly factor-like uncharacterized protein